MIKNIKMKKREMMKKKTRKSTGVRSASALLSAIALIAVTGSCTQSSYLGEFPEYASASCNDSVAIEFLSRQHAMTRAIEGGEAADLLGGEFDIFGTKTEDGISTDIFNNYTVQYQEDDGKWKYDGITNTKSHTVQRLKYWDYSADHYDFVAAAGLDDNESIEGTDKGFRINVADASAMSSIFVANRVTATPIRREATATTPATQAYNSTIQFQFRRLGAQIRIGFYETIPGYAVKDMVFYYIGASSGSYTVGTGGMYPQSGKYTVSYDDATNNALVTFAGAANRFAFSNTFGLLDYTSAASEADLDDTENIYIDADGTPTATPVKLFLGTSSASATYGKGTYGSTTSTAYRPVLPNANNTLPLKLRVDYTLVATDGTKEIIHIRDAWVSVPVEYLQWQPNTSYTYLFRISEALRGYTGEGGGGDPDPDNPGRKPDPEHGGGDNDPYDVNGDGQPDPPYIPDPEWPLIPNPDYDPTQPAGPDNPQEIPDPAAPFVPNPAYPSGPNTDGGDPSNPVDSPNIPNPDYDPSQPEGPDNPKVIPDPENPSSLFPITFDAVIIEADEAETIVWSELNGTENGQESEL